MNAAQFQSELRSVFDGRVEVHRDEPGPHLLVGDHCLVVWDRTKRDNTPYAVLKIATNTEAPGVRGIPRDPGFADVQKMRARNWSLKYGHRKGAAAQVFREIYLEAEERRKRELRARISETARGPVKDYAEWRTGVRNTVSVRPHRSDILTGDRRSRDEERRIKRNISVREKAR